MTLMDEQTAFEEKAVENERKIPSFTLCPWHWQGSNQPDNSSNNLLQSFEDVVTAIEKLELIFFIIPGILFLELNL